MSSISRSRAPAMSPDDRRAAIVAVVVPLLLEHGGEVTTREIAEAAGIAEGTIFRVFPDKAALLMAAAESVLDPAEGDAELFAAIDGAADLHARVSATARWLTGRSEKVMLVMMALRRLGATGDGGSPGERPGTPPQFLVDAQRALLDRLTVVFEPCAGELAVPPRRAALLLRTLVLGLRHPGTHPQEALEPDQVADVLLNGIRTRREAER